MRGTINLALHSASPKGTSRWFVATQPRERVELVDHGQHGGLGVQAEQVDLGLLGGLGVQVEMAEIGQLGGLGVQVGQVDLG